MTIQSKDWHAQYDRMPSTEGPCFRVHGTVTVNSPAVTPVLLMAQKLMVMNEPEGIDLELILERKEGTFLTVVTEKQVTFEMRESNRDITCVRVHYEGNLLCTINDIMTTY